MKAARRTGHELVENWSCTSSIQRIKDTSLDAFHVPYQSFSQKVFGGSLLMIGRTGGGYARCGILEDLTDNMEAEGEETIDLCVSLCLLAYRAA